MNSRKPYGDEARQAAEECEQQYGVQAIPVNCEQLKEEDITRIMEAPLFKMTAANIPAVRISDTAMEECRNRLLDAGHEVCVSEFRGASGRHILKIL